MAADRPYSPVDGLYLKDDFYANDAVTTGLLGEQGWNMVTIGNASTTAFLTAQPFGAFSDTTAATADGDGEVYRLFTDGLVLRGNGGGFSCKVCLPTIATNNFRVGVDDSVTATAPGSGIWVASDGGVLSLECYSNDHDDSPSTLVTGISTLTGGTTMVADTWHEIRVEWHGENGQGGPRWVEIFVDDEYGGGTYCNIANDEEVEAKIVHWQDSGGALAVAMYVDYYELWINR